MSPLRRFPSALAPFLLLASACAPMQVNSFVDRKLDLNAYRTYGWTADEPRSTGDPRLDNNPFFDSRVRAGIDAELRRRGLDQAPSEPDLVVHYFTSVRQRLDMTGENRKYGYCRNCAADVYDAGTLLIDLVEARSGRLVWRGWAEGSIGGAIDDQSWLEERIDRSVTRIFARLPRAVRRSGPAIPTGSLPGRDRAR